MWRQKQNPGGLGRLNSQFEAEAKSPSVMHTVSMAKLENWLRSSAKSPRDKIMKDRLKGLLGS